MSRAVVGVACVVFAGCPSGAVSPPSDGGSPVGVFLCDPLDRGCGMGQSCSFIALDGGVIGSACRAEPCDLLAQNCGPGLKCTYAPNTGNSPRTCVVAGAGTQGDSCSATFTSDTCAAGLDCVEVADGGAECTSFCGDLAGSSDCSAGLSCDSVLVPPHTDERAFVCGPTPPTCDLLAQDCANGLGCYPGPTEPRCLTPGSTPEGDSCLNGNDCVIGTTCVSDMCRQFCRYPSGSPSCSGGTCELLPVPDAGSAGVCF